MQRIIRLQFCINDNVHIWHAKYQFDIYYLQQTSTVRLMDLIDRIMQTNNLLKAIICYESAILAMATIYMLY